MEMNANKIINDDMTLDEKLAAIDAMLAGADPVAKNNGGFTIGAPIDPADATMCIGCQ